LSGLAACKNFWSFLLLSLYLRMISRIQATHFLFFLAVSFCSCSKVQVSPQNNTSTSAIKLYGYQYGNFLSSFQATPDGGYVFGGYTINSDSDGQQGFIQKCDHNGIVKWYKLFGGPKQDLFWMVRPTSDGGYIAAGATTSFGFGAELNNNLQDAYLVRTDGNGNLLWQKTYGSKSTDIFYDVAEAPDHGFVAVGSEGGQFFMVKTDQNGDSLWTRTLFKGYIRSFGASIAFGPNGEIAVASYEQNKDTALLAFCAFSYLTPDGTFLLHHVQYNNLQYNANVETYLYNSSTLNNSSTIQATINLSNTLCCEKIISRPNGFIIVENSNGFKAVDISKIDFQGNIIWANLYSGIGGAVYFNDATNGPNGGLLISGGTFQLNSSNSSYYNWLLSIDANGNKLMESFLPIPENAWAAGAVFSGTDIAEGINLTTPLNTHANYFGFLLTDKNGNPK